MKKSVRKPPAASVEKAAAAKKPAKKKKREKRGARDKIWAALAAAAAIAAVSALSLTAIHFRFADSRDKAAARVAARIAPRGVPQGEPRPGAVLDEGLSSPRVPGSSPQSVPPAAPKIAPAAEPLPLKEAPIPANPRPPVQGPPAPRAAPVETRAGPQGPAANPAAPPALPLKEAPLPPSAIERPAPKGALVFVIDDAGNNLRDVEPFLRFPGPLTIAVLPGLPHSAETARRVRAAGKEVFLHQPMESLGGRNPGPGAIRAGMSGEEIRAVISRNLDEVGPVAGINNHEGSRITMDGEAMAAILSLCRERGILFLDSRTTADTAAPGTALLLGMNIGERDIFVDNVQERTSMIEYIDEGLLKAEQKGSAIMIGHAQSAELAPLLAELFPRLSSRGYSFSTASSVIGGTKP